MHKTNVNLKEQNERLINLNERLMTESENLRHEITQLRVLFTNRQGTFESSSQSTIIRHRVTEETHSQDIIIQENMLLRRKAEELETSLRKIAEQNRTLQGDIENLLRKRDSADSQAITYSKSSADIVQLRQTIASLQNTAALREKQSEEYMRQIEEMNSQFKKLSTDHQRIFEENMTLRRKSQNNSLEEFTKTRISQLEVENKGMTDMANDLKNRISLFEAEGVNKDKEMAFLKEELRQTVTELNSSRGEINRHGDQFREKQVLLTEIQTLNSKIQTLYQDNTNLGQKLAERDSTIDELQTKINILGVGPIPVAPEGLKILKEEFNKYIKSSNTARLQNNKFFDEVLSQVTKVNVKINSHDSHKEAQVKELLKSLNTVMTSHNTAMHKSTSMTAAENNLITALKQLKSLSPTTSSHTSLAGLQAPQESVHEPEIRPSTAIPYSVASVATPIDSARVGQREKHMSMFSPPLQDDSRLLCSILEEETGQTVTVRKDRDLSVYECTITHPETKVIVLPASLIDQISQVNIYRRSGETLVREGFANESRVVETIKPLAQSSQNNQLSRALLSALWPDGRAQSGVLGDRKMMPDLGEDYQLISKLLSKSLLGKGIIHKPNDMVSTVDLLDQESELNIHETHHLGSDPQIRRYQEIREPILCELLALIATERKQNDPNLADVLRIIDIDSETIIERLAIRLDTNQGENSVATVKEVYSINFRVLQQALSTSATKPVSFPLTSYLYQPGKKITQNLVFNTQSKIGLSVLTNVSVTRTEPLPQITMGHALSLALTILLPLGQGQFIREQQMSDIICIDKIDRQGKGNRVEIQLGSPQIDRPTVRKLEANSSRVDSEQKWRSRLPQEVIQEVDETTARWATNQGVDSEMSELLYFIQSQDVFQSNKQVFIQVSKRGSNKVYEKIEILAEATANGPKLFGGVSERVTILGYSNGGKEWSIQKEIVAEREGHKIVGKLTLNKRIAPPADGNYTPNPANSQEVFELEHVMVPVRLQTEEQRYFLDKIDLFPSTVDTIHRLSISTDNQSFVILTDSPGRFIKYSIPRQGKNRAVAVALLQLLNSGQLETMHTESQSTVAYKWQHGSFTFTLADRADSKDVQAISTGQLVVRQRPKGDDMVVEKLIQPRQSILLLPSSRTFSKIEAGVDFSLPIQGVEILTALGGEKSLLTLMGNTNSHKPVFLFLRHAVYRLEVYMCARDSKGRVYLIKRICFRQRNVLAGKYNPLNSSSIVKIEDNTDHKLLSEPFPSWVNLSLLTPGTYWMQYVTNDKVVLARENEKIEVTSTSLTRHTVIGANTLETDTFLLAQTATSTPIPSLLERTLVSAGEDIHADNRGLILQNSLGMPLGTDSARAQFSTSRERSRTVLEHPTLKLESISRTLEDCMKNLTTSTQERSFLWVNVQDPHTVVRRILQAGDLTSNIVKAIVTEKVEASTETSYQVSKETFDHSRNQKQLLELTSTSIAPHTFTITSSTFSTLSPSDDREATSLLGLALALFSAELLYSADVFLLTNSEVLSVVALSPQETHQLRVLAEARYTQGTLTKEGTLVRSVATSENSFIKDTLVAKKNSEGWTLKPVSAQALGSNPALEEVRTPSILSIAVNFYREGPGKDKKSRILLAENRGPILLLQVLALAPDDQSGSPAHCVLTMEEKLFVEHTSPLNPKAAVSLRRDYINGPKTVVAEQLLVQQTSAGIEAKLIGQRETPLKFQEWLAPIDSQVLSLFTIGMHSGCGDIVLRRVKERAGVAYEKLVYNSHFLNEFNRIETLYFRNTPEVSINEIVIPGLIFPQCTFDDLVRMSTVTRLSTTSEGLPKIEVVDLKQNPPQRRELNLEQTIFSLTSSLTLSSALPRLLSLKLGGGVTSLTLQPTDSGIIKLLRVLLEPDVDYSSCIVMIEIEEDRLAARKVKIGEKGEASLVLVSVLAQRTQTGLGPNLARTIFDPSSGRITEEAITLSGDGWTTVEIDPMTNQPQAAESHLNLFMTLHTTMSDVLLSGSAYIRVLHKESKTCYQVYQLSSPTQETLKEKVEIAQDGLAIRELYLSGVTIEEGLTSSQGSKDRSGSIKPNWTRIIQTPGSSLPFDTASALDVFVRETPDQNFIACIRSEGENLIAEKVLIEPNHPPRVIDSFTIKSADLQAQPDDVSLPQNILLSKLSQGSESGSLYYSRGIIREGRPVRQLVRLLPLKVDPSKPDITRLGSSYLVSAELKIDVQPYLLSRGRLQEYELPSREVEYVIVKESDPINPVLVAPTVVGYSTESEPLYKFQLPQARTLVQPSPHGTPSKTDPDRLKVDLYRKDQELQLALADKQRLESRLYETEQQSARRRGQDSTPPRVPLSPPSAIHIGDDGLKKELDATKRELSILQNKLSRLPNEDVHKMILERDDEIARLRRQIEALITARAQTHHPFQHQTVSSEDKLRMESTIQTLETEARYLRQQISELEKEKASLKGALDVAYAELQIHSLTQQDRPQDASLVQIQLVKAQQDLDSAYRRVNELEIRLNESMMQITAYTQNEKVYQEKISILESEITNTKNRLAALVTARTEAQNHERSELNLLNQVSTLQAELTAAKNQINDIQTSPGQSPRYPQPTETRVEPDPMLTNQISILQGELSNAKARIRSLESEISQMSHSVIAEQTDTSSLVSRIASLEGELNGAQNQIGTMERTIREFQQSSLIQASTVDISQFTYRIGQLEDEQREAKATIGQLEKELIDARSKPAEIVKEADPSTEKIIEALQQQLIASNMSMNNLEATLTHMRQTEAIRAETVPEMQLRITHLEGELVQARREIAPMREKISSLEGDLSIARTRVDSLESVITQAQTQQWRSGNSDDLNQMKITVSALQTDLANAKQRETSLLDQLRQSSRFETPKKDDTLELQSNIIRLEAELNLEKSKVANLESALGSTQRSADKSAREDSSNLVIQITTLQTELNLSNTKIKALESDLNRSQQQLKTAMSQPLQDPALLGQLSSMQLELSATKARLLSPEKNAGQTAENEALREQIAKANKMKESLLSDYESLSKENDKLKQQINSLNITITTTSSTIMTLRAEIEIVKNEKDHFKQEVAVLNEDIQRQAAATEKLKADDWMKIEYERVKNELDKANIDIDRYRSDVDRSKTDSDRWREDTKRISSEWERVRKENETLRKELEKAKDDSTLVRTQGEADRLRGEVDKQKVELERSKTEADRMDADNKRLALLIDKVRAEAEVVRVDSEKMKMDIERTRSDSERKRGMASKAASDLENLQLNFDRLKGELEKSRSDQDKLVFENDRVKGDNDRLKPEYERMKNDNAKLRMEVDKPRGDNEKLKIEVEKLKTENDKLKLEIDRFKGEADRVKYELDKMKTEYEKSRFSSERSKTEADWAVERIKNDLLESKKANESLQREIVEFKEERHAWSMDKEKARLVAVEMERFRREADDYKKRISDLERELEKARRGSDESGEKQRRVRELEEIDILNQKQVEEVKNVVETKDNKIRELEQRIESIGRELAAKHSQGHFEEQVLLDMKKKNEFLITEITRLKSEVAIITQKYQEFANRPAPADKYKLTTMTGLNFKDILGENQSRVLQIANQGSASKTPRGEAGDLSFEVDIDSELYIRYMRLKKEYSDLFLENNNLSNQNNKLRSDIITLSGQRLTPEMVALNRRLIFTQ